MQMTFNKETLALLTCGTVKKVWVSQVIFAVKRAKLAFALVV